MSEYYKGRRQRNLYDPKSDKPFKLSRSAIESFLGCQRCFYLDRRRGVSQPPGFPFNLNSAVDKLLKKEFDIHRAKQKTHPLMRAYGIAAVPLRHEMMDIWRQNFQGVQFLHKKTNFLVTGAVDDLWVDSKGRVSVVDYKATSKETEVTLDAPWQDGYKRQMEIYQWLLRNNGLKVNDKGYFVYCNGRTDRKAFDGKLEFDVKIIPYTGNGDWIEGVLKKIYKCLQSDTIPKADPDCDYCLYREAVAREEKV